MTPKKESKKNQEEMYFHGKNVSSMDSTPGINTPGIELPAFNPPVPNRAWTAMRQGKDLDELTDQEKRDLYYGRDGLL